jgi:NitT/TauT family transport system substrate-binding protein
MRIADYLADQKNIDDAAKIMSARVGLSAPEYRALMKGTFFLGLAGNRKHYRKSDGMDSIFGSSKLVDAFNVKNAVYKAAQSVDTYFDASLVEEASK